MTVSDPRRRLAYTEGLEQLDPEAIVDSLADDVTIHVAVHDTPLIGSEVARFLFGVLKQELDGIEVKREIVEANQAVIVFSTGVAGIPADGLNHLELDEQAQVKQLTVFFRPLEALQKLAEVIGPHMESRFGPRPGDAP